MGNFKLLIRLPDGGTRQRTEAKKGKTAWESLEKLKKGKKEEALHSAKEGGGRTNNVKFWKPILLFYRQVLLITGNRVKKKGGASVLRLVVIKKRAPVWKKKR